MIKTTALLLVGLLYSAVTVSQSPSDLFISEYVEGSSYNKYIEIFNGTGESVDLSNYEIHVFTNGNGDLENPSGKVTFDAMLAENSVYVVGHSSADIYSSPNLMDGSLNFNGDDAVCLYKISEDKYLDVIGCIGMDPGSRWEFGDLKTVDKTLIRKAAINCGALITDNENDFHTLGSEWTQLAKDDVSNLGKHTLGNVTSISGARETISLKVSPNPVSDRLFIETSGKIDGIKVFNFAGKEVLSQNSQIKETVDVSALPQGFYLIAVKLYDGTVRSLKFVKR
ncbi:T9SS type A sorting domain-containing protein [Marinilabilia rubra]|uniref:Nuclease n=1 Tax=Marinilabilia rubra TaxID=2162893 RepID=A0A2U2B4K1_9BACT|nr:T9SS type A sorting domain-containing protein [Marinilabilia rubra]PWD97989.1 nuclease [Marinilabilia rubra]